MLLTSLLLQGSLFVMPMYLEAEPPPSRAARAIQVVHKDVPGVSITLERTPEEARARIRAAAERLDQGADFGALARELSDHRSARSGGVVGTLCPGMLPPELDTFLFQAEVGERSEVLEHKSGMWILQRIERDAGCRQILVEGSGEASLARANALVARLRQGEDFAALAKEHSQDEASAARGGALAIYQRSAEDALLRTAVFEARVGEIVGPLASPLGYHILQRVPPESLDPSLAEDVFARGRALLVAFRGAVGADASLERSTQEAEQLARELAARIRAGASMAELAQAHDDDRGGRARGGDLGWIRRRTSLTPPFLDKLFLEPRGELIGPLPTSSGWLLLRREQ